MSHYDPRERHLSKSRRIVTKLFPERYVMIRSAGRLRSIRLGTAAQVTMTLLGVGIAGWVGFSSFMYVSHERILDAKQEEVARARSAYNALLAQVSVYREKISAVAENLERNHAYTLSLLEQNASLDQRLQAVQNELASSEAQREKALRQKDQLVGHLKKLKSELQVATGRGPAGAETAALAIVDEETSEGRMALKRERAARERESLRAQLARLEEEMVDVSGRYMRDSDLDTIEFELRKVILQRDLAKTEAAELREEVAQLQAQLAEMENTQLALFQRFSTLARNRIDELEGAIGKTGLNLENLIEKQENAAQGGPFIPLELGNWEEGTLKRSLDVLNDHVSRWNLLQNLADVLPLGQPLKDYYVSSSFGVRKDPINGRAAMHQGLDLGAPYKSPVFATGPGKVVYAGWRGRYGRLVEIDHGNGLKTRYGHLHKVFVKKGDRVDRSTKIGLLGSTGRSTGPHLHYEVIVHGKPRNPYKFIKAGLNVFKG